MSKPLILVTNDDGITAPGIKTLIEIAQELGDVFVVAPDSPQSGMGHAITIHNPLYVHKTRVFPDIEAYECSGTPVDCVKIARHLLGDRKPDLCVSGINHGSNAALNIIYSGTMSAAMEASIEGLPSIGFSLLDFRYEADFQAARPYVKQIMEYMLSGKSTVGKLISVNIPQLPREEIKGIKVCRQADARWREDFMESEDPRGQKYYWLSGFFVNDDKGEGSDVAALDAGYISVVPSHHDLTHYASLESEELNGLEGIKVD